MFTSFTEMGSLFSTNLTSFCKDGMMNRKVRIVIFFCLASFLGALNQVEGTNRIALVIGNSAYKSAPLKNPANDALDMAKALQDLGFKVICKVDADRHGMDVGVEKFYQNLNHAQLGFFYYAGHGMQVNGTNYLLPVDVQLKSSADVKYRAIKTDWILAKMEDAGSEINIVVLDACRDNPFRGLRSAGHGLAPLQAVKGSFIAYATSPGSVALDGTGRNGIYTTHLLRNIKRPGLTVEEIFREVRKGVAEETNYEQIPWDSSSLMGAFYMAGESTKEGDVEKHQFELEYARLEKELGEPKQFRDETGRKSSMERLPIFDEWMQDPEFAALPRSTKQGVLNNYFDRYIADDEFRALSGYEQSAIRNSFLDAHVPLESPKKCSYTRPLSNPNKIVQDGCYVVYTKGIVRDTNTGLDWKAGKDRDMTWDEARSWVQSLNLDGGGWRMPTIGELVSLYQNGKGNRNMTPLLKTTGWWVWSGETEGPSLALSLSFHTGSRRWGYRDGNGDGRAFAVRSKSD